MNNYIKYSLFTYSAFQNFKILADRNTVSQ